MRSEADCEMTAEEVAPGIPQEETRPKASLQKDAVLVLPM